MKKIAAFKSNLCIVSWSKHLPMHSKKAKMGGCPVISELAICHNRFTPMPIASDSWRIEQRQMQLAGCGATSDRITEGLPVAD